MLAYIEANATTGQRYPDRELEASAEECPDRELEASAEEYTDKELKASVVGRWMPRSRTGDVGRGIYGTE
jgi:hypothetical protein